MKKKPQDATLRNMRAGLKRDKTLLERVRALELKVAVLYSRVNGKDRGQ